MLLIIGTHDIGKFHKEINTKSVFYSFVYQIFHWNSVTIQDILFMFMLVLLITCRSHFSSLYLKKSWGMLLKEAASYRIYGKSKLTIHFKISSNLI